MTTLAFLLAAEVRTNRSGRAIVVEHRGGEGAGALSIAVLSPHGARHQAAELLRLAEEAERWTPPGDAPGVATAQVTRSGEPKKETG